MRATSAWEISRIIVSLEGSRAFLGSELERDSRCIYGYTDKADIDLDIEEARQFSKELQRAIQTFDEVEEGVQEYFARQEAQQDLEDD